MSTRRNAPDILLGVIKTHDNNKTYDNGRNIVLVEGHLDYLFFKQIFNRSYYPYRASLSFEKQQDGKSPNTKNAIIEAMRILREQPNRLYYMKDVFAIIDRDFDCYDNEYESNLLYTDGTDIETTFIRTGAFPLESYAPNQETMNAIYCIAYELSAIHRAFYEATRYKQSNVDNFLNRETLKHKLNEFSTLEDGINFKKLIDFLANLPTSKIERGNEISDLFIITVCSKLSDLAKFDSKEKKFLYHPKEFNKEDIPDFWRYIRGHDLIQLSQMYMPKLNEACNQYGYWNNFILATIDITKLKDTKLLLTLKSKNVLNEETLIKLYGYSSLHTSEVITLVDVDKVAFPKNYQPRFRNLNSEKDILNAFEQLLVTTHQWEEVMSHYIEYIGFIPGELKKPSKILLKAVQQQHITKEIYGELILPCEIRKKVLNCAKTKKQIVSIASPLEQLNAADYLLTEAIKYMKFLYEPTPIVENKAKIIEKESPLAQFSKRLISIASSSRDSDISDAKALRALYYAMNTKLDKSGDLLLYFASLALFHKYTLLKKENYLNHYLKAFERLYKALDMKEFTDFKFMFVKQVDNTNDLLVSCCHYTFAFKNIPEKITNMIPEKYKAEITNYKIYDIVVPIFDEVENRKFYISNLTINDDNLFKSANEIITALADDDVKFIDAFYECINKLHNNN